MGALLAELVPIYLAPRVYIIIIILMIFFSVGGKREQTT